MATKKKTKKTKAKKMKAGQKAKGYGKASKRKGMC